MNPFKALTIAGSDTSGGAGLAADLKTFQEHGVYGMTVITCIVAENPSAEWRHDVFPISLDEVSAQLDTVLTGIGVNAAKTGMLATHELIAMVADAAKRYNIPNLVVDPVMACKGASAPLNPEVANALRDELMPLSTIITPNLFEAGIMSGIGEIKDEAGMEEAARRLCAGGARNVLVKGGKMAGAEKAVDFFCDGKSVTRLESDFFPGAWTHGAGCTISAAITANLASGKPIADAVGAAKLFTSAAIKESFRLNKWVGPLRHDAWRREHLQ